MPREVNACITCPYTSAEGAHRLESRQSSQSMPHSRGLFCHLSTPSCARPDIVSFHQRTAASMGVMTHQIVVCRRRGRATKVQNVASSQRLRRIFLESCVINHSCCVAGAELDLLAEGTPRKRASVVASGEATRYHLKSIRPCHRGVILKSAMVRLEFRSDHSALYAPYVVFTT